jgi:F-type H+-transporting ATPase subunit a
MKAKSRGRTVFLIVWFALIAVLLAAIFLIGLPKGHSESIKAVMRDGVLHDENRIAVFGLRVNPGLISAWVMTGVLLIAAALLRIFAIPRFTEVPGRLQTVVEALVEFFSGMARGSSPHRPGFVGAYIFSAGVYIFFSTLFELFGIQVPTTNGGTVTLPAPLSDVNGAICMGCLSYLVIVFGGAVGAGFHGVKAALKEFSLPISMSFRLFGALLSGLLVTDLVYHYAVTSYAIPVAVGVIFTMLHAVVQTYVLTMLVGIYYNEVSEKPEPKPKKEKKPKKLRPRKSAQAN